MVYKTTGVSSDGQSITYKEQPITDKINKIPSNLLTIPRGGQFFVLLADGTKVWINAETQLKYPVSFIKGKPRKVELLYGEAYFEVSPSFENGGSLFYVETLNQSIEVLGTQFNVKAYKEENEIKTTLVEGKVMLNSGGNTMELRPGQQYTLNHGTGGFTISSIDLYDEISWKNGYFSFKRKSLEDIMMVLSRWYDFKVVFQEEDIKKASFTGIFRRTQNIEDILEILQNTNEISFEINQKTITMK